MISKSKWNLFQVFGANKDRWTEVKHLIDYSFTALALPFHSTVSNGDMCFRVEVFGCDGEFFKLILGTFNTKKKPAIVMIIIMKNNYFICRLMWPSKHLK